MGESVPKDEIVDRRRLLGVVLRASVAAATWATRTGSFPARPPALPQPRLPLPGADAQGGKLIVPTDNPDRFKLKVMEFNPIAALDPAKWELMIGGLCNKTLKLKLGDLKQFAAIKQSSRMKCVQCWSARISWE